MHHEESFFADPRSWVAIAFVIFFVLFGKKIWGALTAMLDGRADAIRQELTEARRLRTEAEAMLRDAASRREVAIADAKKLLDGAKAEAARLSEAAAQDAQLSAARRERMALDRISAAEKAAVEQVRMIAADVATQAAQTVIREELTNDQDSLLIDHAIAGLPAALVPRRAA